MIGVLLALSFVLGFTASLILIRGEVDRISRLLENRDPASVEEIPVRLPFKFCERCVLAINNAMGAVSHVAFEERRHSAELLKGLSDLSHDIRTPLAAAKGHLQLIEATVDIAAPNAATHLRAALSRIDATSGILNQMLELARAMDPEREYEFGAVTLLPALISVLSNHEMELKERQWDPLICFEDEAVRVEGDPGALERVLENVITNSIRHGFSPLTCRQLRRGPSVVLEVSNEVDNPDLIDTESLFRRFYRADRSRTGEGTGLGLPIARALAEGMGMDLTARISGNTITFSLIMKSIEMENAQVNGRGKEWGAEKGQVSNH